jgi:tRNA/rRNA methyltransferase
MSRVIVICHQLRSPDNLGAIARIMANFGFEQLILSDPQTHDFRGSERLGVKAEPVLEKFAVAQTLEEALGDAVYAVGTTSRTELKRHTALSPEEGMKRLAEHAARGRVALVLGGEKRGLSDDELSRCHDVVAIPTPGPQPSMNLANAASVLLYLCSRELTAAPPVEPEVGAPLALVHRLEERLQRLLLDAEFLNAQAPQHVLRELSRALVHGRLTKREAELWLGTVDKLQRELRRPSR